jgi:outer membrane lipoprotein
MSMQERFRIITATWPALVLMLVSACAPQVIPKELEAQVDRNVSFLQVKQAPLSYKNRLIVLGGEVLSVKRGGDSTRIEVLQLPLDGSLEPVSDRTKSLGRFLGVQKEFLDPAILPAGTRVTIVGEVTGVTTLRLDETEYSYPTLAVKHVKLWEPQSPRSGVSIGIGGGVGGGGGFGGVGGGVGF